jgi:hypothetical protein
MGFSFMYPKKKRKRLSLSFNLIFISNNKEYCSHKCPCSISHPIGSPKVLFNYDDVSPIPHSNKCRHFDPHIHTLSYPQSQIFPSQCMFHQTCGQIFTREVFIHHQQPCYIIMDLKSTVNLFMCIVKKSFPSRALF